MNELQLGLFEIAPTVQFSAPKAATIDERCDAFIAANPHVWRTFLRLCLDMQRRGLTQWSSKAAFEVMRYMATVQSIGEDFKLPNDFTSRFARRAMQEVPELGDFFETRELRAK